MPSFSLRLEGVSKSFGPRAVLDGVCFNIEAGHSLVVLGGSGSGKSVMLKCILGLVPMDSGEVYIDGHAISSLSRKDRDDLLGHIGMLFQNAALFDSLPVWENIAFALINARKMDKRKAKDLALEKMALVGLPSEASSLYPNEISGGMQKRVGLARAIACDPKIIFFDEPTTGLDPIMANIIGDLIVRCSKTLGATTLSITHDMASAQKIADEMAMLYQGKIVWTGPSSKMYESENPIVDQFVLGKTEGPIELLGGLSRKK